MSKETKEIRWAPAHATIVFTHMGDHLKKCIERKIEEQLKPRCQACFDRINSAVPEQKDLIAALVAMHTRDPGVSARYLRSLAEEAGSLMDEMSELGTINRSIIINAVYTIDAKQGERFGV